MASRKIYLARNLEDVDVSGADDGDSLVWDAGDALWQPVAISGGGGAAGGDFTDLDDVPASYATFSGYYVRVKDTEDGLIFSEVSGAGASAFTDLSDVPNAYTGDGGKLVVVKDSEDGLEFVASGAGGGGGASVFTDLTDVPNSYSGQAGKHTLVNEAEDALEFVTISGGAWAFEDFTETFGIDQDRSTGGSFTYQQQTIWIVRPILLTSVLWDIRIADDYTLTVRDADETILATKEVTGIGAASADVEFALDTDLFLDPGYYKFRMTPDSTQQWYDKNGDNDYYFNSFSIVYAVNYGGTEYPLYRTPLKLKYYDSYTIAGSLNAGSIVTRNSNIFTVEASAQDAHISDSTWEYIVAMSGIITLDEPGVLQADLQTELMYDSGNWEYYYLRYQIDHAAMGTFYSPTFRHERGINANTTEIHIEELMYVWSGVVAGDFTVRTQWMTTSNMDISFYDRQLTLKGDWEVTGVGGGGVSTSYIHVVDKKANGVAGGTFTQDVWQTRDLTDEITDTANVCSLSSNQITLDAGTYRCHITVPAFRCEKHMARLYNITDSVVELLGTTEWIETAGGTMTKSIIVGQIIISGAAQKVFEVQHYCTVTKADNGFGVDSTFADNIYTAVEFWKIA